MLLLRTIPTGVGDDQKANTKDQQGKEEAKPDQHQRQIETEDRDPNDACGDDLTGQNCREICQQSNERQERDDKGDTRAGLPPCRVHHAGQKCT